MANFNGFGNGNPRIGGGGYNTGGGLPPYQPQNPMQRPGYGVPQMPQGNAGQMPGMSGAGGGMGMPPMGVPPGGGNGYTGQLGGQMPQDNGQNLQDPGQGISQSPFGQQAPQWGSGFLGNHGLFNNPYARFGR